MTFVALVLALVVIALSVRLVRTTRQLTRVSLTAAGLVRSLGESTDTINRQRNQMQRMRIELESHDAGGVR